jgi:nicotinate-nucleotide--dimethylbenzimidazole phosphoribosyltransferase
MVVALGLALDELLFPVVEPIANAQLEAELRQRIDQKTKPIGALGRLEALALQIGLVQRSAAPRLHDPHILVVAADHGLTQEGVSAYPSSVTAQMVTNMLAGGAAVNVFAKQMGFAMTLVNAGVASPVASPAHLPAGVQWINRPIAAGTANSLRGPAMSEAQLAQAINRGIELGQQLPGNVLALGEMGIGNTSAATLLACKLLGLDVLSATGRGTGLSDAQLTHKQSVLAAVLNHHAGPAPDAWTGKWGQGAAQALWALQCMGGLEIAVMAGAMLGAASSRKLVLVDGLIASAAALVASRVCPAAVGYLVCAHQSAEPAAAALLSALGQPPLLNLGLRLGEGTGALLAYPLVQAACNFLADMTSFESAQVSGPVQ